MTTARWVAEVPATDVRFADLHLTQERVVVAALFGQLDADASTDRLPHVVDWGGRLSLEDGHNRVVRAALAGAEAMPMRVYRVPAGT